MPQPACSPVNLKALPDNRKISRKASRKASHKVSRNPTNNHKPNMEPENFIYWLQGFLSSRGEKHLNASEVKCIETKLNEVKEDSSLPQGTTSGTIVFTSPPNSVTPHPLPGGSWCGDRPYFAGPVDYTTQVKTQC
jgi:hypothetical protein